MERLRRGWALTKESWAVVRGDRSLLVFPVIAGVCAIGGAVFLLGILPGALVIAAGIALTGASAALGAVVVAVGVVIVVVAMLVQATLGAVFRVALYRYATSGAVLGHFHAGAAGRRLPAEGPPRRAGARHPLAVAAVASSSLDPRDAGVFTT